MGHSRFLFLYFRLFNTQLIVNNCSNINKFLPMTGFELQTSGIGSDRSTNWATTTAQYLFTFYVYHPTYLYPFCHFISPLFVQIHFFPQHKKHFLTSQESLLFIHDSISGSHTSYADLCLSARLLNSQPCLCASRPSAASFDAADESAEIWRTQFSERENICRHPMPQKQNFFNKIWQNFRFPLSRLAWREVRAISRNGEGPSKLKI